MVWAVMSDPLGLSVGTTNLVAARVGNQPVTRRSVLTLPGSTATISGFVERVGDRVPLVSPDGKSYLAEQLLVEALDAMVAVGGGPSSDIAIAVPAHWGPSTTWAFRSALANSRNLSQTSEPVRVVSDAVAALTALQANPGITVNGVVALLDFGGSGTSITLADAAASFQPIGETMRYTDFSGDLIDQALLAHVLDDLAGDADPAGTTAVESLTRLREECRLAKERLSADTATELVIELPGYRADIRLTRDELQELILRPLDGVIAAVDDLARAERDGADRYGRVGHRGWWRKYSLCHTTTFRAHPAPGGDHTATSPELRGRRRALRGIRRRRRRTDRSSRGDSRRGGANGSRRCRHRCHRCGGGLRRPGTRHSRLCDVPGIGLVAGRGWPGAGPVYR